ncbi:hypothetical protein ACLKA6_015850 [Drosophila palustris]
MALLNFVETLEIMAYNVHRDEEQHHRFGSDAQFIVDTIIAQLQKNNSIFQEYLKELRTTASFVSEINMDLPLAFEVFLPLRLPFALHANFNESERSVQFSKRKISHPFFFGNVVNAKCMNILLQRDLKLAISQLRSVANYYVKYSTMSFNRAPFAHQVFAMERGSIDRGIHFDFILALEFDGAAMPLPSYYNAPISYKWLAYGLVPVSANYNSSDWGVLLPRWQNADFIVRRRSHNMLLLLYRLLYVQRCYGFAVPFLLKLCFFMATADRGENYKNMGVAELMITLGNSHVLIVLASISSCHEEAQFEEKGNGKAVTTLDVQQAIQQQQHVWQNADFIVRRRSHNMLLLLYRLLYVQRCYGFAIPFLLKLCFFMATADRGENYKNMGVAELMITTFGHQVFRNFHDLIAASTAADPFAKIFCTISMGQLQVHGRDILAMLLKGFQLNVISSELIKRYFQIDYMPEPQEKDEVEVNEDEDEMKLQLIEASSSRKRRRSI